MASALDDDATSDLGADLPEELDALTRCIGADLFRSLRRNRGWFLQRRFWDDRIMNWAMSDEQLKIQLFRFVDVLPMLGTSRLVAKRLGEYLNEAPQALGRFGQLGLALMERTAPTRWMLAALARRGATSFARKFIAGTTVEQVMHAARQQRRLGRTFTLDILGEAVTSSVEADRHYRAYVDLLEHGAAAANAWVRDQRLDHDAFGPQPRLNLSIKLSALDAHFDPIDADRVAQRVGARLAELLRVARRHGAFVNVDMESYEKKDLTLRIFRDVVASDEFRDWPHVGIVVQCYLRDSAADFESLRDWARQRGTAVWVRLVKGAYWDYETAIAQAEGWPVPVYQQKWESDANFERQVRFAMQNIEFIRPALGSHNLRSLAHGIATAERAGLPHDAYEIQMLYGMADAEKDALVRRGHRVRVYMPYGELIPGMAYLVRRLLENTSNDSFLRAGLAEGVNVDQLMANPAGAQRRAPRATAAWRDPGSAAG
jgi:RHH-type proline utilization regulon transcriptional repressor/proline dehydrogenase/delta 1-pyrroline-5-carboxylate dehydrogenase